MDSKTQKRLPASSPIWEGIARRVCDRHGIQVDGQLTRGKESNPVFLVNGEYVVKFYTEKEGPERAFAVESTLLRTLACRKTVPAPRLLVAGQIDSVEYLVMTAVDGKPLGKVWSRIGTAQRAGLARDIGTLLRHLHRTETPQMVEIEARHGGWKAFTQQHGPVARERVLSLPMLSGPLLRPVRRELVAFLKTEAPLHLAAPLALNHADLGPSHIFLAEENGIWHVSGIIDFAAAMLAPIDNEWADGLQYLFPDDPVLRWQLVESYYVETKVPDDLARRCLANLMHSYAPWYPLRAMHKEAGHPPLRSLDDLLSLLFPLRSDG